MAHRPFTDRRLLIATHNRGKILEFEALLTPLGISVTGAPELGLAEPEETGDTFVANAVLKAQAAAAATGLPTLADDSGIAVEGLNGAPGIYSARWAGPDRDFKIAMRRVREELVVRFGSFAAADKRAAFVCALCLAWPDGHHEIFEGRVDGTVLEEPVGAYGFGYDPLFVPSGHQLSFGQMPYVEKQAHSHRARAVDALLSACFGRAAAA